MLSAIRRVIRSTKRVLASAYRAQTQTQTQVADAVQTGDVVQTQAGPVVLGAPAPNAWAVAVEDLALGQMNVCQPVVGYSSSITSASATASASASASASAPASGPAAAPAAAGTVAAATVVAEVQGTVSHSQLNLDGRDYDAANAILTLANYSPRSALAGPSSSPISVISAQNLAATTPAAGTVRKRGDTPIIAAPTKRIRFAAGPDEIHISSSPTAASAVAGPSTSPLAGGASLDSPTPAPRRPKRAGEHEQAIVPGSTTGQASTEGPEVGAKKRKTAAATGKAPKSGCPSSKGKERADVRATPAEPAAPARRSTVATSSAAAASTSSLPARFRPSRYKAALADSLQDNQELRAELERKNARIAALETDVAGHKQLGRAAAVETLKACAREFRASTEADVAALEARKALQDSLSVALLAFEELDALHALVDFMSGPDCGPELNAPFGMPSPVVPTSPDAASAEAAAALALDSPLPAVILPRAMAETLSHADPNLGSLAPAPVSGSAPTVAVSLVEPATTDAASPEQIAGDETLDEDVEALLRELFDDGPAEEAQPAVAQAGSEAAQRATSSSSGTLGSSSAAVGQQQGAWPSASGMPRGGSALGRPMSPPSSLFGAPGLGRLSAAGPSGIRSVAPSAGTSFAAWAGSTAALGSTSSSAAAAAAAVSADEAPTSIFGDGGQVAESSTRLFEGPSPERAAAARQSGTDWHLWVPHAYRAAWPEFSRSLAMNSAVVTIDSLDYERLSEKWGPGAVKEYRKWYKEVKLNLPPGEQPSALQAMDIEHQVRNEPKMAFMGAYYIQVAAKERELALKGPHAEDEGEEGEAEAEESPEPDT